MIPHLILSAIKNGDSEVPLFCLSLTYLEVELEIVGSELYPAAVLVRCHSPREVTRRHEGSPVIATATSPSCDWRQAWGKMTTQTT